MIVQFSESFETGEVNTEYFQDLPFFRDEQIEMLLDFIEAVEQGLPLKGKNKTSWQDNAGNILPNTDFYQENHCWHYHSGEYRQEEPRVYTINLCWNIDGLTSSAVIHYQKITEEHIFILAYSPKHIPFPRASELNNPVLGRVQ